MAIIMGRASGVMFASILVFLISYAHVSAGATNVEKVDRKVFPNDPQNSAFFGYSLSAASNFAVIGAPGDSVKQPQAGAAYFISSSKNGANPTTYSQSKIYATNTSNYDLFGYSVATDGTFVLVGAPRREVSSVNDAGLVYVFQKDGDAVTEIHAQSPSANSFFGQTLAFDGTFAAVGDVGSPAAVHVFTTSWGTPTRLQEPTTGSLFGSSVDVSNPWLIVGAPGNGVAGKALLYQYSSGSWSSPSTISAPTPTSDSNAFGASVSISGTTAVVGAPGINTAFVFQYDTNAWVLQATLTPSDSSTSQFGNSVSIDGTTIVVGAPFDSPSGEDYKFGAVYIFEFTSGAWTEQYKLVAGDRSSSTVGDEFGQHVSLSGNSVVISTYLDEDKINLGGAVYFSYTSCPSNAWGDDCLACSCAIDRCNDGLSGDGKCTDCTATTFGPLCDGTCTCSNGTCRNGINGDGKCSSCNSGFYGSNCDNACGCVSGSCDSGVNGTGACTCDNTKFWGTKCEKPCTCTTGTCDHLTGKCATCKPNYFGIYCAACFCVNGECIDGINGDGLCDTCSNGFYGPNCTSTCDCSSNQCSFEGICICDAGYILGDDKKTCIVPPAPEGDLWSVMPTYGWVLLILFLVFFAIAMIALFVFFYLKKKKAELHQ